MSYVDTFTRLFASIFHPITDCRPRLRKTGGKWECRSPSRTGIGATPEQAFCEWRFHGYMPSASAGGGNV